MFLYLSRMTMNILKYVTNTINNLNGTVMTSQDN